MLLGKVSAMESDNAFFLENASWPVLLVNLSGQIRGLSRGAARAFGPSVAAGQTLAETIWSPENDRTPEEFLSDWGTLPDDGVPLRLRGRDKAVHTFRTHLCPIEHEGAGWLLLQFFEVPAPPPAPVPASAADSTSAANQKLAVALHLIRTVTLDLNNALTSLLGHASLLLAQAGPQDSQRASLLEIEKSARRAAESAQDLAQFGRAEKEDRAPRPGNLNDVLRRTVESLEKAHPQAAAWELDLEPRPLAVLCDEAKIEQVLVKVFENSLEAFERPGRIRVLARNVQIGPAQIPSGSRLAPGAYYRVEIADDGPGIPGHLLPRLFQPFFTTRKDSGHRGLGLVLAYGIVTTLGGSISVFSEEGRGTTVDIHFPAQPRAIPDPAAGAGDLRGSQTILMVDDEEAILGMADAALPAFGYRVFTASSGQKALEIFEEKRHEIDVVVTDLVMPLMSGRDLVERLRRMSPGVRVICASGIVRPTVSEEHHHLRKPYSCQELVRKIKEVLAGESTAGS